jgi:glutamyl-tRNA reductase
MWQELSLVHSKPREKNSELVWQTCLRRIQFLSPGSLYGQPVGEGQYFRGSQAHRFLVEVCSGLHSPLLGETEVFGQFRAFRDSQMWHPAWIPLLDAVEEDVKKIRRTHLRNIGAQSYGSLARKRIPEGAPVVLVGAGRLAQDLIPWLKNPVTLLARNPAKLAGWDKCEVKAFGDAVPQNAHWIIAAPVANEDLLHLLEGNAPETVLDFRGERRLENCPAKKYQDLSTLFAELELVRSSLTARRESALNAVEQCSQQREATVYHRPYGWEDAFA